MPAQVRVFTGQSAIPAPGDAIAGSAGERSTAGPISNNHPTVKPIDLMRWLVRLITPRGALVLDPFAGSGTTGVAAHFEGCDYLLIEQEPEAADIARARLGVSLASECPPL
jgi:site-specific DNA-methyltransferase (adenine-specific)